MPTRLPLEGSPLIDAGSTALPGSRDGACTPTDQRGVARPQGARCDVGATELATGQSCSGGAADDRDGDGLCSSEDSCPAVFNPGGESVPFDLTLRAASRDVFDWEGIRDVRWIRGDLALVSTYDVQREDVELGVSSLTDESRPSAGQGYHYAVRLDGDCNVASWQTRVGAEPLRDETLS